MLIVELDSITDFHKLIILERCLSRSYNTRIIVGALYFMRWTEHVARMRIREMLPGIWLENTKERDHLENLDVDARIIQK